MLAVVIIAAFFIFLVYLGIRAQFRKRQTGREGIVGEVGIAKTKVDQSGGTVFVHGEFWNAVSDTVIKKDARVKVVRVDAMTLTVERVESE